MTLITTLDLSKADGMAGRITSTGQVFAEGDIPAGSSVSATADGNGLPVQMDVLSSWPDGSVKHAILSFETPDVSASTLAISVSAGEDAPALDLAAEAAEQGYAFSVTIDGEQVDIAALVQQGPVDLWQSGPLVTEGRVTHTLSNGLEIRADVTVKADGTIDTSITVGNDNVDTTSLDALTYAVEITQGDETVFSDDALTQYHFTVWRETFSTEDAPNTSHLTYDIEYLRATGLLPSVDTGLTLSDGDAYGDALSDPNATYDPMELGGVDNDGGIDADRGRTGPSKSYGVVTDDQHSYLVTQSAEAREGMLALTDQYGAFSDFYRNPETGEAYLLEDVETNSFYTGLRKDVDGTGGVVDLTNDGLALRNKASHDPSAFYTAYLVTGDRFYADGLVSEAGSSHLLWANAASLTEGGAVDFGSQLREQAWILRDLFYAATLAPDGSHAKPILEARLEAALQDYVDYYVNGETLTNQLGRQMAGSREAAEFSDGALSGVLQSYNGTAIDRPYWQDWFGMVIGQIAATGNALAQQLGEWMANFSAGRFLQDDFDASNSLYSLTNGGAAAGVANSETTWAELQAIAEAGDDGGTNDWQSSEFYAASTWGGTASLFSGTRDARYAEALLWMTNALSAEGEAAATENGVTTQFAIPVTFLDYSIAGISDRSVGTDGADEITDGDGNRLIAGGDGDDTITTGAGNHLVDGGDGDDVIVGGSGEDWLFGGSGSDRLISGEGVNVLQGDRYDADFGRFADSFVFDGTLGETEVLDFTIGQDLLELIGFDGMRRPGDVLPAFVATEDGAVLDLGDDGRLLLRDVDAAALTADGLRVVGPNTAPDAQDDAGGSVVQGRSVTLNVSDLLANDSDPDGDAFSMLEITTTKGGSAVLNPDDTITFTAAVDLIGPASFTYAIRDEFGADGFATVSFEVLSAAPVMPETTALITGTGWLQGTDASEHFIPLSDNIRVFGRGGDDLIELNGFATVAKAGAGDDTITFEGSRHVAWGNSGEDTFIVATGSTRTAIIDFNPFEDSLVFANGAGGMSDVEDVMSAMEQVNSNVVIRMDGGLMLLRNTELADVMAGSIETYADARDDAQTLTTPETVGPTITGSGWLNGTDDNDMIVSGGGNVRLSGGFGDDHMISEHWAVRMQGGAGDDLLESRAHDAILRGDGGADTFLFRGRVDGRIDDFNGVDDLIAFDGEGTGFADFSSVLAAADDRDGGVVFASGAGDELTLVGVQRDTLTEDMFLFV